MVAPTDLTNKLEFDRKNDTERVWEVTNTDQPITHWVRRLAAKLEFERRNGLGGGSSRL